MDEPETKATCCEAPAEPTEEVAPFTDLDSAAAQSGLAEGRFQVLDVRFANEYAVHHIPGAILIPLPELPRRYAELDRERDTLVVCEHGMRSVDASYFLCQQGFKSVFQLAPGMAGYRGPTERGN